MWKSPYQRLAARINGTPTLLPDQNSSCGWTPPSLTSTLQKRITRTGWSLTLIVPIPLYYALHSSLMAIGRCVASKLEVGYGTLKSSSTFMITTILVPILQASIHSPLPNMPLNYTLTIDKVGRCLNNCSGHGACDGDGICQCSNGRLGGDCSVDTAKANHPWRHLFYSIFLMAVGVAFALAYVSFYGMPAWVPIRRGTFHFPGSGIGLYQELSEHEGI